MSLGFSFNYERLCSESQVHRGRSPAKQLGDRGRAKGALTPLYTYSCEGGAGGEDNRGILPEVRMFSAAQSTFIAPLTQRAEKGVQAESKARWLGTSSGRRVTLNPCEDPKWINIGRPGLSCYLLSLGAHKSLREHATPTTAKKAGFNQEHVKGAFLLPISEVFTPFTQETPTPDPLWLHTITECSGYTRPTAAGTRSESDQDQNKQACS